MGNKKLTKQKNRERTVATRKKTCALVWQYLFFWSLHLNLCTALSGFRSALIREGKLASLQEDLAGLFDAAKKSLSITDFPVEISDSSEAVGKGVLTTRRVEAGECLTLYPLVAPGLQNKEVSKCIQSICSALRVPSVCVSSVPSKCAGHVLFLAQQAPLSLPPDWYIQKGCKRSTGGFGPSTDLLVALADSGDDTDRRLATACAGSVANGAGIGSTRKDAANCEIIWVKRAGAREAGNMLCGSLFATAPIDKGQEIFWDYGDDYNAVIEERIELGTAGRGNGGAQLRRCGKVGRPRVPVSEAEYKQRQRDVRARLSEEK